MYKIKCLFSARHNPQSLKLPSELYYYSGECNNSNDTLLEIQNKFIKLLNQSAFKTACINYIGCSAENVEVSCGPVLKRRKRLSDADTAENQTVLDYAYTVKLYFTVPFVRQEGISDEALFTEADTILNDMADILDFEIKAGNFSISGLDLSTPSFVVGFTDYVCPPGTLTKSSASCGKTKALLNVFLFLN